MRGSSSTRFVAIALLSTALACGTIVYPERRGMEAGERIDPVVVLMDGVLLLAFVVPGVVAFGVDFATGAIYEPSGSASAWAIRPDGEPLEMSAAVARALELRVPPAEPRMHTAAIWWETRDGTRIPTRAVHGPGVGHYRLEASAPLAPGPHRLVVSGAGGVEHRIPVLLR
jgi:hypothetical protein